MRNFVETYSSLIQTHKYKYVSKWFVFLNSLLFKCIDIRKLLTKIFTNYKKLLLQIILNIEKNIMFKQKSIKNLI